MGAMDQISCILCGGSDFEQKFAFRGIVAAFFGHFASEKEHKPSDHTVLGCKSCGLGFRQDVEVYESTAMSELVDSHFAPQNHQNSSLISVPPHPPLDPEAGWEELQEIGQYKNPPGDLLTIGGIPGDMIESSRLFGWNASFSQDFPQNFDLKNQLAVSKKSVPKFDVIHIEYSLERADNPFKYVHQVGKILRKDGLLVITFPDSRFCDYPLFGEGNTLWPVDLPKWFFSPDAIQYLLDQTGFKILKIQTVSTSLDSLFTTNPEIPSKENPPLQLPSVQYLRVFTRREEERAPIFLTKKVRAYERNELTSLQKV